MRAQGTDQALGHDAEHVLLDCLGETIWRAQSQGQPMDAMAYVDAVKRKASLI